MQIRFIVLGVLFAAAAGFAAGRATSSAPKITGIGGVFFKSKHPKELAAWYEKHLGLVPSRTPESSSSGAKRIAILPRVKRRGRSFPTPAPTSIRPMRLS